MPKKIISALLVAGMVIQAVPCAFAQNFFKTETICEVEDASLKGTMITVDSPYASDGQYVTTTSSIIATADDIYYDGISWIFNIEQTGQFRTFIRVYFSNASATGFYYRWDNGEWNEYSGTKATDFEWINLDVSNLTMGTHKLQISHKQANVWFDAVYVTEDTEFVPQRPEGTVEMKEEQNTGKVKSFIQEVNEPFEISGNGRIIEAEDVTLESGMGISIDKSRGGGKAVTCGLPNAAKAAEIGERGSVEFTYTAKEDGKYNVWGSFIYVSSLNCIFLAYDTDTYSYYALGPQGQYNWMRLGSSELKAGESVTVRILGRASYWNVDQFIVTKVSSYVPNGVVEEISLEPQPIETSFELPPYNPPAEHPRVYFRQCDVEKLKEKLNADENKAAKAVLEKYTKEEVNIGASYNATVLDKVAAKAYSYALFKDKEVGRDAVELAISLSEWSYPAYSEVIRYYGATIECMSIVYDWCYDIMTSEERQSIILACTGLASMLEIGWPPTLQGMVTGHGAEAQLLQDLMSFAIAVYDERPDVWNAVGGRFYSETVPAREWELKSNLHHQGSNYGSYRNAYTQMAYLLITGMGLQPPYDTEDTANIGYSRALYFRRPDGTLFMDGDMYSNSLMTYVKSDDLFYSYVIGKDAYLKDEYVRSSALTANKDGLKTEYTTLVAKHLIFNEPEIERKSVSSLPLSRYFGSPMGTMIARTGWEYGIDSDTAVAQMSIGEYWFGNHQHRDAGNFQIYYKGPLATESGFYHGGELYGGTSQTSYSQQTIAHNSVIVYDPDEDSANFNNKVNDGGQKVMTAVKNTAGSFSYEENAAHAQRGEVLAHEIDPSDTQKPDYTYLKGELEKAYSDKVNEFKRSFMFLNLDREDVPAALIVFDKVTASDSSFKKTWLLHGQSVPKFDGTRTIWNANSYKDTFNHEYTGKMVVDSLLPEKNNIDMKTVGGPDEGWCIINGVDYTHPEKGESFEENTYRLEISPKQESETDYFLNCIQVTDRANSEYLDVQKIDTDRFYGVKLSDRIVLFSKSGEKIAEDITLSLGFDGEYKYTVCDMTSGTYSITSGDEKTTVSVSEEGGVLSFTANGNVVSISKESNEITVPEADTEKTDVTAEKKIFVKCDGNIVGLKVDAKIVNGKLVVPISDLAKWMRLREDKNFINVKFIDDEQEITVLLRKGSDILNKDGENIKLTNAVTEVDGEMMVELRAFAESFNYIVYWDDTNMTVHLVPNKIKKMHEEEGYAKIAKISDDGGTIAEGFEAGKIMDNDISTLYSSSGRNRYVDFELKEETILENVEIIFNPNSKRTPYFEIQVSSDGENFVSVYEGVGDSDADGMNWETFEFDIKKLVKGKYIRYVAKGSNVSEFNGVKEIRFKIGTEMITWDSAEDDVAVKRVLQDLGEIEGTNLATNLLDRNSRTVWTARGRTRYVDFELEDVSQISGIDIVFMPYKSRTAKFEILVSADGKNYTSVFNGNSNPEITENIWESFEFTEPVTAAFVRYIAKGSDIDGNNGVKEIRLVK